MTVGVLEVLILKNHEGGKSGGQEIIEEKGIINSGYQERCESSEDIANVREDNEIVGDMKVIEILHIDD